MPIIKQQTERLALRLTSKDKRQLAVLAYKQSRKMSDVVRAAIRFYLEFMGGQK